MHIENIPNRNSKPTILLRESYREGGKVKKRTLANLTKCPPDAIDAIRAVCKGKTLCATDSRITLGESRQLGNVLAIKTAMDKLRIAELISPKSCDERSVILALLTERLIRPASKLSSAIGFENSTIPETFGLPTNFSEDKIYEAMDWILERRDSIERKLAARHLGNGDSAFYDLSCSSYHGTHCPLAQRGHNRDKLPLPAVEYGLLTDCEGRPVSISVYPGNTGDPSTVPDQVDKLRKSFKLKRVSLVGDRGMLTQAQIDKISENPGLKWISCLRSNDIKKLIADRDPSDMPLFTETNIAEITHKDFPGERLVACFNPFLQEDRTRTRNELLAATERDLKKIKDGLGLRKSKPYTDAEIGSRTSLALDKHKMRKHFILKIENGTLTFERNLQSIKDEEALDGIYVIRTNISEDELSAGDAVKAYKSLGNVEKAFRTMKGMDVHIRPIYHRLETRVKAHIFLCMLAYYIEWHMRQSLSELLYAEDDLPEARASRDPVAQAKPTTEAMRKKRTKKSASGFNLDCWRGVMDKMGTLMKSKVFFSGCSEPVWIDHVPSEYQQHVLDLLKQSDYSTSWKRRQSAEAV